MSTFNTQRAEIERQAKEAGVSISFAGYSETNGLSIYFIDENGNKYRFSNHGIFNRHRLETELTFPLPFVKQMKLGGIIEEVHNVLFN